MGDVLIKLFVFPVFNFCARQCPERSGIVDSFVFALLLFFLGFRRHDHRKRNVVRVLLHQVAQAHAIGKLFGFRLQLQHNFGATLGAFNGFDGKFTVAFRRPMYAFRCGCTGAAGKYVDLVCYNK